MPAWARRDEAATKAARKERRFLDRRSWIGVRKNGDLYLRLHGKDKSAQRERLDWFWHNRCALCGKAIGIEEAELDHKVSLGRGGDDQDSNLQFLCRPCHAKKHNRSIHLRTIPLEPRWEHEGQP